MSFGLSRYKVQFFCGLYAAVFVVLVLAYNLITIGIIQVVIGYFAVMMLAPFILYVLIRLEQAINWVNAPFEDLPRRNMLKRMSPEQRDAFLAEEKAARHRKENGERERQYLDAIAIPQMWCLVAMREGRNYTRGDVPSKDVEDILAWATSNDIAVTVIGRTDKDAKLSFGELRRAKKTARFMGEPV